MPFLKKRPWIAMALVVACICMWGCGLLDDEERFVVDKNRTNGYLVAIIDDSLAIMQNMREWELWDDDCNSWEYCDKGTMNPGIFLVNYRKKQSPLWGDTVEGRISIVDGYFHDSSALFSTIDGEFGFWKIGGDARIVRKWKWDDSCKWEGYRLRGSAWIDGKILMKGAFHCGFAILDTTTGNVSNLEYTGDYAWLEGCDDITYIDGDVVCLKALYDEKRYGVYEYGKDGLMDSLIWNDANWSIYTKNVLEIRGNMFTIKHPTKMIDGKPNPLNGTFIHYLKPLGTPDSPVRIEYNNFIDSMGVSIGYSSEDLIVTK
ncbi:MAG: hypothetical protein J6W22_12950 [Fibrobacter sp.]|nr:hypothetical protein [Fibrobacter sp.]